LQIIKSNGTTLAAFILNMGEIVRFEKDPNLKLTAVHAGEVLQHFHKNLRERGEAPKRGMQVKLELQENLPPMRADNDRLHRILQRLIDNALAYTPNGGQITLKAAADGDTGGVVLAVEDNGVGINPNDYERIFKRYERGHIPDKLGMIPGAGMGLSIAEMYTRAHGGKIWFESELDRGTTFYVQIPTYHTK
jgi:two-component system sensor histidine kinase VicK